MALRRRCPNAGLLHHSDQGSTYASEDYQRLLDAHGITCSMSRRGDCYDNAVMEAFFSSLKSEFADRFASCGEAKMALFDYVEALYNAATPRSATGVRLPSNARRPWTLSSPWAPRTRPQGTWKSRREREIPTATTALLLVARTRKERTQTNSVNPSTESDQGHRRHPASTELMSKRSSVISESVSTKKLSLVCMSVLTLCGIKFTWDLAHTVELALWDETSYMIQGLGIIDTESLTAELGPLYSLWYRFLSVFQPDTYALYFQNARILALLLPLLVFFTLRSLGVRALLALVISWFYLISFSNIYVWPRINHFAVCIMLLGWLLGHLIWKRTQSWSLHLGILSIAFLVASYARPEQFVGFGVLALASIGVGLLETRATHSQTSDKRLGLIVITPALLALVLSIFAVKQFGNPVASGGRGFGAFCQHYALNATKLGIFKGDPWMDCGTAIRESFGQIESLTGALRSSPLDLAVHFGINLARYVVKTFFLFFTHFNLLIPATSREASAVEGIMFMGAFALAFWKWGRLSKDRLRLFLANRRTVFVTFFLMLIPTFISVIVIYPKDHYLLLQEVVMFLGVGIYVESWMASKQVASNSVNSRRVSMVLCCVLLLTPSLTPPWYWARKTTVGQNALLLALHQAPFKKGETLYVAQLDYGYQVFLSNKAEDEALPDFTQEPPEVYFAHSRANVMVLNSVNLVQLNERGLSGWKRFTVEPEKFGFQKIPAEGGCSLLLAKNSILDSR